MDSTMDDEQMDLPMTDLDPVPQANEESIEEKIMRADFIKIEEDNMMGHHLFYPDDCLIQHEITYSEALDRYSWKVVRSQPMHLTRLLVFRELDADFSFSEYRIQTRWKCLHVQVALHKARKARVGTGTVSEFWRLYLEGCREAKESPRLFANREKCILAFNTMPLSQVKFPELTIGAVKQFRQWFIEATTELEQVTQPDPRFLLHNPVEKKVQDLQYTKTVLSRLLGCYADASHKQPTEKQPNRPATSKMTSATAGTREIDELTSDMSNLGIWKDLETMSLTEQLRALSI